MQHLIPLKIEGERRQVCVQEEFDQKLGELVTVIPSIAQKLDEMEPSKLAALVQNPAAIASKVVQLKALLPGANIERLVLRDFQKELHLLLQTPVEKIATSVAELKRILPPYKDLERYPPTPPLHRSLCLSWTSI